VACRSGDLNGKFMMMLAQNVWFAWAGTTGRETRSAHVDAEAHVTPLMYSVIMKYHSISCLFFPRIQKPGAAKQAKNHTKELTEGEKKNTYLHLYGTSLQHKHYRTTWTESIHHLYTYSSDSTILRSSRRLPNTCLPELSAPM